MRIDQLTALLQKKYSVKGMIDIADLSYSPQAAYQFFYSVHQNEFAINDRIVLYTSRVIPESFLQHLYQVINFIDISNWFILICTPDGFIDKADQYSTDPVAFQQFLIELEETKEFKTNYYLPETICAVPWTHIEIRNNGTITPCCMSNDIVLGDINTTTMSSAFHSDQMQKLREQFLAGAKPAVCNRCWKNENRGLTSTRMHNIKRLKKEFLLNYLERPTITSIDIKFNNTCNFKCRICNSNSSSLYAAEQKKFLGTQINLQSNWSESDNFIKEVIETLPHLTNIDMYGGEPFLIKKFANVLSLAVEQGHAKNIRLHYNSNGSIWPKEIIPYWKHFKGVDIHFSIDAIGKRFELQRGGVWKEVEANILKIKNLKFPNMNICLMPTISIMSIYYIDEVYDWAKKHGFEIFLNNLTRPENFNIKNLTHKAQQLIFEKFKNHPWSEIQNILSTLQTTKVSGDGLFIEKIKWFDSIRQETFADSHPEIARAMGIVLQ